MLCRQDPELHRRQNAPASRVLPPGERQSRQFDGRQEEPEQDHRIPEDAARLESAGHHDAGSESRLPSDTPETIRRDIKIIQHELPLDVIEFFRPDAAGLEDHQTLCEGIPMDAILEDPMMLKMSADCAREDEPAGMGEHLSRGGCLLFAGTCEDCCAGPSALACRLQASSRCWCPLQRRCRSKKCIPCKAVCCG